jgi:hypothetical protein
MTHQSPVIQAIEDARTDLRARADRAEAELDQVRAELAALRTGASGQKDDDAPRPALRRAPAEAVHRNSLDVSAESRLLRTGRPSSVRSLPDTVLPGDLSVGDVIALPSGAARSSSRRSSLGMAGSW